MSSSSLSHKEWLKTNPPVCSETTIIIPVQTYFEWLQQFPNGYDDSIENKLSTT